jgi:hypothetical protein
MRRSRPTIQKASSIGNLVNVLLEGREFLKMFYFRSENSNFVPKSSNLFKKAPKGSKTFRENLKRRSKKFKSVPPKMFRPDMEPPPLLTLKFVFCCIVLKNERQEREKEGRNPIPVRNSDEEIEDLGS